MGHTVDIDCRLDYAVEQPAEFLMQLQAAWHPGQQIVRERLQVTGATGEPVFFEDVTGLNRLFRFSADPGSVQVRYEATVTVQTLLRDPSWPENDLRDIPGPVLHYLLPSRYCESDLLGDMARRTFGRLPRGFGRVEAICDWIQNHIEYLPGSSTATTSARDVLQNRAGVCRDFAHLGITFCRALNIPARFVFGYVEFADPPPDFHALFEAWVGGQWVLFDPTKMAPIEKLVRIGTGVDAKDVAFATLYGAVRMLGMQPLVQDHVPGQDPVFEAPAWTIGAHRGRREGAGEAQQVASPDQV